MSTVSDAIIKDHRELRQYYNEVVNSTDHDHQQRYGNQFTWELARHSVGEELVVYPAMEKYMGPSGKEMAESDRQEHHHVSLDSSTKSTLLTITQVKDLLKQFQNMSPSDQEFIPKLKEIWSNLERHIGEEEGRDLPALEKALQSEDGSSESLATSFGRTKMFVPTRSHPSAGEKPPFETAMGLLMAPMDLLADLFRKFPK